MLDEFWKSLAGSFEKRWLTNVMGPALIFWGCGLWVWAQLTGLKNALKVWQGYEDEIRVFLGVMGLLLVFTTALLLEAFARELLRFFEGYWPRRSRQAKRRADDLHQKQEHQRVLRTKVVADQATPAERAELARLNVKLSHRPRDPDRSMPTRLGDVLRTAEDYSRQRYGLDPVIFWPRLYPHLSEPLRDALGAVQERLDLTLRLATLAALHGTIWSIVVVVHRQWLVLWWTLPAFPLAWLLWRAAHPAAVSYAGLLRSAFDLHRFDSYKSMCWPKPGSPAGEKAHGEALVLYLVEGVGAQGVVYNHDEKKEKKED